MRRVGLAGLCLLFVMLGLAQQRAVFEPPKREAPQTGAKKGSAIQVSQDAGGPVLLKPARVFDGVNPQAHEGWVVLVRGERIEKVGPSNEVETPTDARVIELPGTTLLPALIEGPSHLLLHPYNAATWTDQVLQE